MFFGRQMSTISLAVTFSPISTRHPALMRIARASGKAHTIPLLAQRPMWRRAQ
jgi:hypothetical protein